MSLEIIHVRISGAVQGVGFRYFTLSAAQDYGITGWAANRPDGTVEVEACAEPAVLDRFLLILRQGPRHGRVDSLDLERSSVNENPYEDFEIR